MKFVDQVRIQVKAGDGGNGAVAFRREKYIERGGPSGGDGGNGGSVIFVADQNLSTLLDYRYQQHQKAKGGEHGMGSDMNGRSAPDLILKVPVGTLIKDANTGDELADLSEHGQQVVIAQGGRGGLGNMNFATSTRQAPRFAQDGKPGEERYIQLELKLLADVGLLGFPNAGKSTLISRVSRARPKVADYPFTTLVPNLGMVQYRDERSFVMADIPGIIEGAAEGAGLGHQFLRHVERCRVLIHVLDLIAQGEDRDPLRDYDALNAELEKYSPELARKPQIVAANKMDIPEAQEKFPILEDFLKARGVPLFAISAATGQGIQPLLDAVARVVFEGVPQVETRSERKQERPAKPGRRPAVAKAADAELEDAEVVDVSAADAEVLDDGAVARGAASPGASTRVKRSSAAGKPQKAKRPVAARSASAGKVKAARPSRAKVTGAGKASKAKASAAASKGTRSAAVRGVPARKKSVTPSKKPATGRAAPGASAAKKSAAGRAAPRASAAKKNGAAKSTARRAPPPGSAVKKKATGRTASGAAKKKATTRASARGARKGAR